MRLVGYIRVSRVAGREGDSFISPEVQRERIERYAAEHGHEIVALETDLDVSGGTMARPGYERVERRLARDEADGIAVARLDRFSRTLDGALTAARQLDERGKALVSAADNIDPSTPSGKAMFRMLLVIAELQRDMIRASWNEARIEAIKRGVHISTHVAHGYMRDEAGRLVPDPETAPGVVAAFEARAAGRSWAEVGEIIGFTRQGAIGLVRNRAYLGEARAGDLVNPEAHEPLVSRELFESAQSARGVARGRGGHLLSGLARCATCRHALAAGSRGRYRCLNQRCPERAAITADRIEANVRALYAMFVASPAAAEAEHAGELREAVRAAESELHDFVRVMRAGEPGFREGLDARQAVVAEARRQLAAVAQPALVALDPDEPVADQRRKLSRAIVAVFVRPGKGDVTDRVRVVWNGTTVELPTRGAAGRTELPPFPFGDRPALTLVKSDPDEKGRLTA